MLGAEWPGLEPLLMQVPQQERRPLLDVLQSMPRAQLQQLATLAQRTPPQERAALRAELVAMPAAGRAEWLRKRRRL